MKAGCWGLWLLGLAACESKGEPAVPMDTPTAAASAVKGGRGKDGSRVETGLPDAPDAPLPESARSLPDVGDCFSACVDRNRMRAVAAEQIDGDCKRECSDLCLAQCESGSRVARESCRRSCENQSTRLR